MMKFEWLGDLVDAAGRQVCAIADPNTKSGAFVRSVASGIAAVAPIVAVGAVVYGSHQTNRITQKILRNSKFTWTYEDGDE